MWMLLVLFYGLCKGGREIVKKKAMGKSTVMEVLLFYTLVSFLMVTPEITEAGGVPAMYFLYIAIKSFTIFIAWICSFKALKKLPLSLFGVLDLSRVLFATLLGVIVLGEALELPQIIGIICVSGGLLLLKYKPPFLAKLFGITSENKKKDENKEDKKVIIYIIAAFTSCLLNAVSGTMDKMLMRTGEITSSQLQFWYMLFLLCYYIIYMLLTREKVRLSTLKNGWIWLLAILFVLADKALFVANGVPDSKVTIMTLIKQSGCLVTILGGKFVFKEEKVGYKLFCAAIIIAGIVAAVL